jgi:cephalosporin hydroxylase
MGQLVEELKNFHSDDPVEVFNFARTWHGGAIRPIQDIEEFTKFLAMYKAFRPRSVMEIGSCYGGALFCFCRLAAPDATIISVDIQPAIRLDSDGTPVYDGFVLPGQKLYFLHADSHSAHTIYTVKTIVGSYGLDLLFIDGDHHYEAVKADFEAYWRLVRPGGIVAFHDIAAKLPNPTCNLVCEVWKLWQELKECFPHWQFEEILATNPTLLPPPNIAGIGLIYKV